MKIVKKLYVFLVELAHKLKAFRANFLIKLSFLIFLVILFSLGFNPISAIKKNIAALVGEKTSLIKIYPSNYITAEAEKTKGWWNVQNAIGQPNLENDASFISFSDSNSAFYSGGKKDFVLKAFRASTDKHIEDNQDDPKVEVIDFEKEKLENNDKLNTVSSSLKNNYSSNATSSLPDNLGENANASTSDTFLDDDSHGQKVQLHDASSSEALELETSSSSRDLEESGNQKDNNIKEKNNLQTEADPLEIFDIEEAGASGQSSLNEIGKFKNASINFSLAMQLYKKENDSDKPRSSFPQKKEVDEIKKRPIEIKNSASSTDKTEEQSEEKIEIKNSPQENSSDLKQQVQIEQFEDKEDVLVEDSEEITDGFSPQIVELENFEDNAVDKETELEEADAIDSDNSNSKSIQEEIRPEVELSEPNRAVDSQAAEDADDLSLLNNLLNVKMAEAEAEAVIDVWYSIQPEQENSASSGQEILWQKLTQINKENLSNFLNKGYLSFEANFLKSWDDVENLNIKLEGLVDEKPEFIFYLDSVWVEAEYIPDSELKTREEKLRRWNNSLEMLSNSIDFKVGEEGEMEFKYSKSNVDLAESLGGLIGMSNYWKDVSLSASIESSAGEEIDLPLTIIFKEDGEFSLKLPAPSRNFEPGRYKIRFRINDESSPEPEVFELTKDFRWGVLAFNTNKAVYNPFEEAFLQMTVLDDSGHTVCDADVSVKITPPSGEIAELSTMDGSLIKSNECGPKSITKKPDYSAHYTVGARGTYKIKISAKLKSGIREISDSFLVRENDDFEVEREAPTRVNPKASYKMKIRLKANVDFNGDIYDKVPAGFKILSQSVRLSDQSVRDPYLPDYYYSYRNNKSDELELKWNNLVLLKGDVLTIEYVFDAPDISPELYLLGPLELKNNLQNQNQQKSLAYNEGRTWQIASDAVSKRAKTVMFFAGTNTGDNANANNALPSFNFRLAESGVEIKNAYVMLESQFEAYNNTGGNYSGYELRFDSCEETCTPDSFGVTGNRVVRDDNTTLAYDEAESNNVRLLLDVTNETELANYTGDGVLMDAEVGYRFENSGGGQSIASAKAILYITYIYDESSENLTNTAVYPLDSANGTDSGSRQASVGACTRNTDCPLFDYNMDIQEFPGVATSSNRLSQWFRMNASNDSNNSTDLDPNVNIQTFDVNSTTYHHEAANAGTQGNIGPIYFGDWVSSGYAENSSQQLEFYINSGNNYNLGGEIFETYISSSSASVKTRTVSFPLGVINDGTTATLSSDKTTVYFPENGTTTGVVAVKSAWFRIITHNPNNGNVNLTVSSKVGANATSTGLVYAYNGGGTVVKPTINIYHIIPSADYSVLEAANATSGVPVQLNTTFSSTNYGGVSAELMITYTYIDETPGYLTSLNLFGGQLESSPATTTNLSTANSVMPEAAGKRVLAAGLYASFLNSDSAGDVGAGTVFTLDADFSTSTPSCVPYYEAQPDSVNSYSEFYKDVTSKMNTIDNQAYTACYASDEPLVSTDGAKSSGQFIYTYQWDNSAPAGSFNSAVLKKDGSGVVDISIEAFDIDGQDTVAKIDYETGTSCAFLSSLDPTLDENGANITADFGDPGILNSNTYQVGVSGAYIETASGSNSVFFDWDSSNPSDLQNTEGDYCLRLTLNDKLIDQDTPATTTVYIDNIKPTASGDLSLNSRTGTSVTLNFGATSTETNFYEYKIFYKQYDGTDPTESDALFGSSTDVNLADILFNGAATTSISSLIAKTTYSFAIWTYDAYGNRASSSRVDVYTNDAPLGTFNSAAQKSDGTGLVDISIEVDDANNDDTNSAELVYEAGSSCAFVATSSTYLDETQANVYSDFGITKIDNNFDYQVGSSSGYILTSPGSNTVEFDWLTKSYLPAADGTYCLRLTVNDGNDDQAPVATTTLTLDNVNPSAPGAIGIGAISLNSIELIYATTSPATDTNEPGTNAYRIFYKEGTSGVKRSDTEYDSSDLDAYNYNGATSTTVSGLNPDTNYVFNIWSYDSFGNLATSTEVSAKTNSTINNNSLTFTNATSTNIVIAGTSTQWNFRANVSETDGWYILDEVKLRLADKADYTNPFSDLEFTWSQSTQSFAETGTDVLGAATLSSNSTSTCAGISCTIDFKVIINKNFASTSVAYDAELYSTNDTAKSAENTYSAFYDVRRVFVEQIHYRWRNDDGGE